MQTACLQPRRASLSTPSSEAPLLQGAAVSPQSASCHFKGDREWTCFPLQEKLFFTLNLYPFSELERLYFFFILNLAPECLARLKLENLVFCWGQCITLCTHVLRLGKGSTLWTSLEFFRERHLWSNKAFECELRKQNSGKRHEDLYLQILLQHKMCSLWNYFAFGCWIIVEATTPKGFSIDHAKISAECKIKNSQAA